MFIPCVLVQTVQLRANGWAPCIKWSTLEAGSVTPATGDRSRGNTRQRASKLPVVEKRTNAVTWMVLTIVVGTRSETTHALRRGYVRNPLHALSPLPSHSGFSLYCITRTQFQELNKYASLQRSQIIYSECPEFWHVNNLSLRGVLWWEAAIFLQVKIMKRRRIRWAEPIVKIMWTRVYVWTEKTSRKMTPGKNQSFMGGNNYNRSSGYGWVGGGWNWLRTVFSQGIRYTYKQCWIVGVL